MSILAILEYLIVSFLVSVNSLCQFGTADLYMPSWIKRHLYISQNTFGTNLWVWQAHVPKQIQQCLKQIQTSNFEELKREFCYSL